MHPLDNCVLICFYTPIFFSSSSSNMWLTKSPWKKTIPKLKKTMLTTRNTNWNSKDIRNTNSHINHFLLIEKQNPFNERRSSCASFIIKWIIAKFITKVPREKQNGFWEFRKTLIDMIVHKHGDKALAQYSNKFWTNDPI
jgi:hypothetical protein